MNVVVESLSKLVIPNEGSNLHSELRLETMLTEFSNILENKNKVIYDLENTIIELEHKLAEDSKDRDELKHNYCLIDGPQQKIYHKNNVNLSPPFMEGHVQAVEQINNTQITDANPPCESHHSSKGQNLPTINMSKKRQDNNNAKVFPIYRRLATKLTIPYRKDRQHTTCKSEETHETIPKKF